MHTRPAHTANTHPLLARRTKRRDWVMAMLAAFAPWSMAAAWEHYPMPREPGYGGIVIGDFDGDGITEAVAAGTLSGFGYGPDLAVLTVIGGNDGPPRVRDALAPGMQFAPGGLVLARRTGERDRVVGAGLQPDGSWKIATFGGVPLRLERLLDSPSGYRVERVFAVADVDGDGEDELIVGLVAEQDAWPHPAILDGSTGAVRWLGDQFADSVAVAQLDADPALEIIVSGTPGLVIDGATHAVEWSWAGGFGSPLVSGRFGTGHAGGFVSVPPGFPFFMQLFSNHPYVPLFEIRNEQPTYLVASPRGDGVADEIAAQGGSSVRFFDPLTGLQTRQFLPGSTGPFAIGDIVRSGRKQLIRRAVGDPATCLPADGSVLLDSEYLHYFNFSATDLDDGDCHRWVGKTGPHATVVRGALSAPGSDQIASFSHNNVLTIFDADSGAPLRFRSGIVSANSPPNLRRISMLVAARSNGTRSLVVAAEYSDLVALDPVTLAKRWTRYFGAVSALSSIDVNGDGFDEIVAAGPAGDVTVINTESGAVLGQSTPAGSSWIWPELVTFHDAQGHARALVTSEDRLSLDVFDLATVTRIGRIPTGASPVTALWSWGEGSGCRVAVLDAAARIGTRDCNGLVELDSRQAPPGTVFVREADATGEAFIVAAGEYLYRVGPDSVAMPVSPALGSGLGAQNAGDVRPLSGGNRWDATMGSNTLVTRRVLAPDPLFANGFE